MKRALSVGLAAALALPAPGAFASEPTPDLAACALSVASDPAGAAVYVNGALRGATPVNLGRLPPGAHRVTVVKDGYLENSRLVRLAPGERGTVEIRMTPGPRRARYTVQQRPESEGRGGSKVKYVIPLALAGGAAAFLLLRDTNKAPAAGTISASPSSGIAGATRLTFTASGASDPEGDPLTFNWSFGDGSTGSGQTVTHLYNSPGGFSASLSVSDGKKTATAPSLSVTISTLSGTWRGTIAGFPPPTVATITQTPAGTFLGTMSFPGFNFPGGVISGQATSPFNVIFTVSVPTFQAFTFNGTSDPTVTRLTGTAQGSGFLGQAWMLTKQ